MSVGVRHRSVLRTSSSEGGIVLHTKDRKDLICGMEEKCLCAWRRNRPRRLSILQVTKVEARAALPFSRGDHLVHKAVRRCFGPLSFLF